MRGFRRNLGLQSWHKAIHFNEHAMRRCLWKCTAYHLFRALWQQFSPPCQPFCSAAWELSSSLGLTRLRFAVKFLKFQSGFFFWVGGGAQIFSVRYFCVPTMNLFYASVTVTHPSGCKRIWYLFSKQAFVLKWALNFLYSTEYWFESC